ncbi:hypothetical protein EDD11_001749 [Mortierella claussenii]|nr:hypothetical protein EDD11_001749 [Mortierella claussenii]
MKNKKHPHSHEGITDAERYFVIEGIVFSIPTTCLFVVMDILVHRQSGQDYSTELITQKMLKAFPAVLVMVYFSNKNKANKLVQTGMFLTATVCGCYFLHTMFKSPALAIMKRAPGVITILVYCIIQLNLVSAIASLAICGLYYIFENATFRH